MPARRPLLLLVFLLSFSAVALPQIPGLTPPQPAAAARGVWLRPFRDLIYTMPPFISADDEVEMINAAIVAAVRAG